ncbi:hypothetical protein [Sphingosinicella sp. CPCC 101087]|uniref:hypothetical protein n=1 Tax=Sphingosinicella sp. CPCC 101087 TaxID=2497754 RepID=UPI00101D8D8E|nr:hypothetical protein [Sphingosinicella sp. CPCC 101087]
MKHFFLAAGALSLLGTPGFARPVDGPHAVAQTYPPCAPGPGDDSCIQLHEQGRALGGPYEPIAGHADASPTGAMASEAAMNEDAAGGSVAAGNEAGTRGAFRGVGGPAASQSDYPPCELDIGQDRCIQTYERDVSGTGN